MKVQILAAFLVICLLSLDGARAAPWNSGSFDNNAAGDDSFNNNGNGGYYGAGNRGSFDGNNVGDDSFNNNGNSGEPFLYY
ncbi:uncharacterized protein LOC132245602 [Alligator mississippiensis]|uniref:Uncharacterized protein n=1 Tax=Alligator mississippiensis TaxID=8496 RepID=A0A151MW12_ALLMI|nr:uncharacterized protein LOC132245602 [Alligator mississippiensis]KYO28629.1 hypothetical protein Y1Q_0013915 [Alligator mississippiensis]